MHKAPTSKVVGSPPQIIDTEEWLHNICLKTDSNLYQMRYDGPKNDAIANNALFKCIWMLSMLSILLVKVCPIHSCLP